MKVGVISAFKHKPSQQKLQKEKRYLLRTAGYRSLSESEYNDLCLFGPLFLVPVFLISSFLPCVCPHFLPWHFCCSGLFRYDFFYSSLFVVSSPLSASTGFAGG